MNRFILSLVVAAFAFPVSAQSSLEDPSNWGGAYLGFQIGFPLESTVEFESAPGLIFDLEGINGGVQLGYLRQSASLVYGGEIEFLVAEPEITFMGAAPVQTRVTTTRVGGVVGYDLGRFLPYGTLGLGRMTFQDTEGFGDTSSFGTFGGLGFEFQAGEHVGIGLEATRQSYENFNEGNDASVNQTSVAVRLNIRY